MYEYFAKTIAIIFWRQIAVCVQVNEYANYYKVIAYFIENSYK